MRSKQNIWEMRLKQKASKSDQSKTARKSDQSKQAGNRIKAKELRKTLPQHTHTCREGGEQRIQAAARKNRPELQAERPTGSAAAFTRLKSPSNGVIHQR